MEYPTVDQIEFNIENRIMKEAKTSARAAALLATMLMLLLSVLGNLVGATIGVATNHLGYFIQLYMYEAPLFVLVPALAYYIVFKRSRTVLRSRSAKMHRHRLYKIAQKENRRLRQ
jgi:ABC-type antimicrobial peptide transport system permease subunit